jgi:hypothetical protein
LLTLAPPPAIELPLGASAVAGNSMLITVTLNTQVMSINTTVRFNRCDSAAGTSLMPRPADIAGHRAGLAGERRAAVPRPGCAGAAEPVGDTTTIYSGTTYCMRHVIPLLPSGVTLTSHTLCFNGAAVLTVDGASRALSVLHGRA